MKRAFIFILLFTAFASHEKVPEEVTKAISESLEGKGFFKFFDRNKGTMGFNGETRLSDITAGEPFQLYFMYAEEIQKANTFKPISSYISHDDQWYVPLYVKGELLQSVLEINQFPDSDETKAKWSTGVRKNAKCLVQAWKKMKTVLPKNSENLKTVWIIGQPINYLCFFIQGNGSDRFGIGAFCMKFSLLPGTVFSELVPSKELSEFLRSKCKERQLEKDSLSKEAEGKNIDAVKERELMTEYLWKDLETGKDKSPHAIPDSVVTVCRFERNGVLLLAKLVPADSTVIPARFVKKQRDVTARATAEPDARNPMLPWKHDCGFVIDGRIKKAALPIGKDYPRVDEWTTIGHDRWYVLPVKDHIGSISIGATGPLVIDYVPYDGKEKRWAGGYQSSFSGPPKDADLIEISLSHNFFSYPVSTAYLRIRTMSADTVFFRISFLNIGTPQFFFRSPGTVAREYIKAIACIDETALFHVIGVHSTMEQVTQMHERLFGIKDKVCSFREHRKPDVLKPDLETKLHVQHIILSSEKSIAEKRHWAFRIICKKSDNTWIVAEVCRDPDVSDTQVAGIVNRDLSGDRGGEP